MIGEPLPVTNRGDGNVPAAVTVVGTRWTWRDHLGALAVRCGIGRERYFVEPGLYAIGQPGKTSPLLASAVLIAVGFYFLWTF